MNDKEFKESMKRMRALQRKHKADPEAAKAFLIRAGILTKSGKLAKPYREQGA